MPESKNKRKAKTGWRVRGAKKMKTNGEEKSLQQKFSEILLASQKSILEYVDKWIQQFQANFQTIQLNFRSLEISFYSQNRFIFVHNRILNDALSEREPIVFEEDGSVDYGWYFKQHDGAIGLVDFFQKVMEEKKEPAPPPETPVQEPPAEEQDATIFGG